MRNQLLWIALLSVSCAAFEPLQTAAHADPQVSGPRAFEQLPEAVRKQAITGEPRSSQHITESPFGTSTSVCFKPGRLSQPAKLAPLIAAAGYKWVGEFLYADWAKRPASAADIAGWAHLSTACTEHLARLSALGVRILMRVDPLPSVQLAGRVPVTAEQMQLALAYTRAVVAQLKPYVSDWQLGNEPNLANAPEAFVEVLAQLSRAVRAEQPSAVIYGPGVGMLQCLADEPFPWLPRALEAGLTKHIDVFSYHPYRANGDPPERASEFARWRHWSSYDIQLGALRKALASARASHAKAPLRLAVTEDGEASAISASGEQGITPVMDAKHELRRSLLDFAQGIAPRLHFTFYRDQPDVVYNREGSFNVVSDSLEVKPLYYAVQNLNAVLDSSCTKTDVSAVRVVDAATGRPPARGSLVQTYLKQHETFDELLVFFWAPVLAQNMHLRVPVRLQVSGAGWEAPVLIDLMTMPGFARPLEHARSDHKRVTFPASHWRDGSLQLDALELRDYPQLLKLIRVK